MSIVDDVRIRQYRGEDGWGSKDPDRVIEEPNTSDLHKFLESLEGRKVKVIADGNTRTGLPKASWRKLHQGVSAAKNDPGRTDPDTGWIILDEASDDVIGRPLDQMQKWRGLGE